MTTLNMEAPAAPTTKKSHGDGHYYGFTEQAGWFPLYKDGGTFGMREARKLHEAGQIAMPSATGYIKCLSKPHLEDWKNEQVAKACWGQRNTIGTAGNEDEFVEAAIETASNASKGAMDLGTAVHQAIEDCINGKDYAAEYDAYVTPVMKEMAALGMDGSEAEQCVGSLKYGVGGKVDITHRASMTIGDTKTRGHKILKTKASKVPYYETDLIQTACYGYCTFGNAFFISGRAVILAVSTVQPGLVTPHVFTGKELVPAFEAFLALTTLWRFTHNCDPRRPLFAEGVK